MQVLIVLFLFSSQVCCIDLNVTDFFLLEEGGNEYSLTYPSSSFTYFKYLTKPSNDDITYRTPLMIDFEVDVSSSWDHTFDVFMFVERAEFLNDSSLIEAPDEENFEEECIGDSAWWCNTWISDSDLYDEVWYFFIAAKLKCQSDEPDCSSGTFDIEIEITQQVYTPSDDNDDNDDDFGGASAAGLAIVFTFLGIFFGIFFLLFCGGIAIFVCAAIFCPHKIRAGRARGWKGPRVNSTAAVVMAQNEMDTQQMNHKPVVVQQHVVQQVPQPQQMMRGPVPVGHQMISQQQGMMIQQPQQGMMIPQQQGMMMQQPQGMMMQQPHGMVPQPNLMMQQQQPQRQQQPLFVGNMNMNQGQPMY